MNLMNGGLNWPITKEVLLIGVFLDILLNWVIDIRIIYWFPKIANSYILTFNITSDMALNCPKKSLFLLD